ncbi:MAG: hypothetical protein KJO98_13535 [Rhodothermia bacterium]|nr:hypothetical protein [Rhodothermia bacterium]
MRRKIIWRTLGVLVAAFIVLSIPLRDVVPPAAPPGNAAGAFVWDQDSLWLALERQFAEARSRDCGQLEARARSRMDGLARIVDELHQQEVSAYSTVLDSLESGFFALSPVVAACPALVSRFTALYSDIRESVKSESVGWDLESRAVRDRLYRLLYGSRAALEEVLLQHPDSVVALIRGRDEPSATPSASIAGVTVHSGDLLVSRGGYPTSALIARGSDYPGNFSHVALVHVDEVTGAIRTIESHIEIGVAIFSADEYLSDKKLRILVLRPRAELPQLREDPLLPDKAAEAALARAIAGHVPYDFAMDYEDPSKLFCSEVASSVYSQEGVDLWMGISRISSPGLRRWLASFGVRHFETQEPSDLEYDPQLAVVAEWRDPSTLFEDHVDNAVTDAMLEGAERGDELEFKWYELPPARVAKGFSWLMQKSGTVGPVPEGMTPAAALRNRSYTERHDRLASEVLRRAAFFREANGYVPPYWQLLEMARAATADEPA